MSNTPNDVTTGEVVSARAKNFSIRLDCFRFTGREKKSEYHNNNIDNNNNNNATNTNNKRRITSTDANARVRV